MTYCYPAIILSILSILTFIQLYGLSWTAGIVFALPFIVFARISFLLCKKGYNKIAWLMILGSFIPYFMLIFVPYISNKYFP